jgi:RNA polymerase sigma-54 factor
MTRSSSCAPLIGVIILTRFLKLPLLKYEKIIEKVKNSPILAQILPSLVSINLFPRAQVLKEARGLTPNSIGQLQEGQEGFYVSYRHAGLAGEYVIDEGKMSYLRQTISSGDETKIQALQRQLRLINTRNRLTHMTLMGIAEYQRAYLVSGDPLYLTPLSRVALTEWIRYEMQDDTRFLPPGSKLEFVDHSMLSRLTRSMSVLGPQGQEVPLRDFFPSTRDVHKRLIEAILEEEKEQIRRGDIEGVCTDAEIKKRLKERFGVSISRRTVSACRQDMRIPSSYTRNNNHHKYPPRETHFSFHYPFHIASVKANAPEAPGVYEISLAEVEVGYPLSLSGVVYIGSAKNIRKRLRDHLRPGSKNGDLRALLSEHRAIFRYVVKQSDVRAEEKKLCQCFILAYGSLPQCNRIRP